MVTRPQYSNQITFGNILSMSTAALSALTAIIVVSIAWADVNNRSMVNAQAIAALTTIVERDRARFETMTAALEQRVRTNEINAGRNDERYNALLSLMQRMDGRLERIEENQGKKD